MCVYVEGGGGGGGCSKTYPFPNFNDTAVEVGERVSNFILTLYRTCDYLSMLGLRLIHVSSWGAGCKFKYHKSHYFYKCKTNINRNSTWKWLPGSQAKFCPKILNLCIHYTDVIMGAMASQIPSLTIVYSTVCSGRRSKETSKLRVTGLCEGNSPVTGEFPAQMASNAVNVSIWWRHHVCIIKNCLSDMVIILYMLITEKCMFHPQMCFLTSKFFSFRVYMIYSKIQ